MTDRAKCELEQMAAHVSKVSEQAGAAMAKSRIWQLLGMEVSRLDDGGDLAKAWTVSRAAFNVMQQCRGDRWWDDA